MSAGMVTKFSQTIYTNLKTNGYADFTKMDDSHILDEHTRCMILLKADGPVWYAVYLVNADQVSLANFAAAHDRFTQIMAEEQDRFNVSNIFIVTLFYAQEISQEIKYFIQATGAFEEKSMNSVFWGISLDSGSMEMNQEQPTKIANIRKIIDDSYNQAGMPATDSLPLDMTVGRLNRQAYEKRLYQPVSDTSVITFGLIAVNLIIFAVMELNGGTENVENLIRFGALIPFDLRDFSQYYRLVSSMFIHVGYAHILFNCLSLYIFGVRIERHFGKAGFLIIYFISGICGSFLSRTFLASVSAGASGGIYGLVGAMAVLTYKAARSIDGLNSYTMIIYIIFSLGIGAVQPQIDNFGHLGGLIGGLLAGALLLWRMDKKQKQEGGPDTLGKD